MQFFDFAMLAETGNWVSCPGYGASKRLLPLLLVARGAKTLSSGVLYSSD
jgi:hypothetical protein